MNRFTASRRSVVIALALGAALGCLRVSAQQGLEYEVKAAYLYNIIDFVTWPSSAFANASDPIRVCIVGADPFGAVLDRTMAGPGPDKRAIVVERVRDENGVANCSLIFVPRASAARADAVIRSAAARPMLTVGDTPEFLDKGGMLAFAVDGGRVRFDVNPSAAAAKGLGLSSRLLRVARNVVGNAKP